MPLGEVEDKRHVKCKPATLRLHAHDTAINTMLLLIRWWIVHAPITAILYSSNIINISTTHTIVSILLMTIFSIPAVTTFGANTYHYILQTIDSVPQKVKGYYYSNSIGIVFIGGHGCARQACVGIKWRRYGPSGRSRTGGGGGGSKALKKNQELSSLILSRKSEDPTLHVTTKRAKRCQTFLVQVPAFALNIYRHYSSSHCTRESRRRVQAEMSRTATTPHRASKLTTTGTSLFHRH